MVVEGEGDRDMGDEKETLETKQEVNANNENKKKSKADKKNKDVIFSLLFSLPTVFVIVFVIVLQMRLFAESERQFTQLSDTLGQYQIDDKILSTMHQRSLETLRQHKTDKQKKKKEEDYTECFGIKVKNTADFDSQMNLKMKSFSFKIAVFSAIIIVLSMLIIVPFIVKGTEKKYTSSKYASHLEQYKKIKELELEKAKLKLQAKLKLKPLKHSFLISLSTTIFVVFVFLGFVYFYWYFQDAFVIEPEFYDIKNDFCKLALVVLSRTPIIVFFIVGLLICKRCFTWYDKYRDYLSLWEYHSRINDKDKQDDLLIALAPNYFGTKRNRRSDNNFMEKLLLKMIPTLNINAGGGSNNGNNGGQNGGKTD